jgi:beta-galactosidase
LTGYIGGEPVASLTFAADPLPTTLEIVADSHTLKARERDSTRVIIRALDQCGQRLPFMNDSISLKVHGPGKIVGPANVPLQGGTAGFWLEATGLVGEITVEAISSRFAPVTLTVTAAA